MKNESRHLKKQTGEHHEDKKNGGIQVIKRMVSVMRVLGEYPAGLSLTEIAHRTALPRSTVQRIISALVQEHIVASAGASGGFCLGPGLGSMLCHTRMDMALLIRTQLETLASRTHETVCVGRLSAWSFHVVDVVQSEQVLRVAFSVGTVMPLLIESAAARVLMACVPEEKFRQWIAGGPKIMVDMIHKDYDKIVRELAKVREQGYALDEENCIQGVSALSMPLRTYQGNYAVTLAAPAVRMSRNLDAFRAELGKTCEILTEQLGAAEIPLPIGA